MTTYTLSDVIQLVDKYSNVINFWIDNKAVDGARVKRAEEILGLQFTSSYKDFLKNYKGGKIGNEEILSLYDIDLGSLSIILVGDIVYQYFNDIRLGLAKPQQLVVSRTDLGETIYFDYSQFKGDECPLYFESGFGDCYYYASNFYEFLCKRIKAHTE
ncbi:SMI1/KNR4 family protein [Bartonella sp. B30(2025)]